MLGSKQEANATDYNNARVSYSHTKQKKGKKKSRARGSKKRNRPSPFPPPPEKERQQQTIISKKAYLKKREIVQTRRDRKKKNASYSSPCFLFSLLFFVKIQNQNLPPTSTTGRTAAALLLPSTGTDILPPTPPNPRKTSSPSLGSGLSGGSSIGVS